MRILIVSYFCPPEVAAPASRVFENASRMVGFGHEVTILTGLPNHPVGCVFEGYRRRVFQEERVQGVRIVRAPSLIAPNTTALNRLKSYASLMFSQIVTGCALGPFDVVLGTSPPLFQAFAGWALSVAKGCPFVFEVRDLWPENMVAVGALRQGLGLRLLAAMERLLLSRAARIVVVTNGFADYYRTRGIPGGRLAVVTNGIDVEESRPTEYPVGLAHSLGLDGAFIVGYIGTVGINHGLKTVLDCAEHLLPRTDIRIVIVGDGAERAQLEKEAHDRGLRNVRFLGEQPREAMPEYHALCDVILVLLKNAEYFHRVIPSKIFVAMGLERPILIGVDGEARRIVESAGAGVFAPPEDPSALAQIILRLADGPREALIAMGRSGRAYVADNYDRNRLAAQLQNEIQKAVAVHKGS